MNPLALELERVRSSGRPLYDLTRSNPTEVGVPFAAERIRAALAAPEVLRYRPDALGPSSARAAIAADARGDGLVIDPERILITASTSEAYGLLFKLLCDPDDEILVPQPSYPLFEQLVRLECARVVMYPLGFDERWFIDFAELEQRIGPRSRAIVVVSPNNPTGNYLKRSELARLAEFGLPIVSDEVFASYSIDAPVDCVRSVLETAHVLNFALSGLSKLAALPQMKLAWTTLGGPSEQVREALSRLELMADAYLSPSTPALVALPELLAARHVSSSHVLGRVRHNAAALRAGVSGSAVSVLPIEGGWYAVLRLPALQSEEDWVLSLLRERSVLVQPGFFYDFAREAYVVVSLLTPEAELAEGLERLLLHVASRC